MRLFALSLALLALVGAPIAAQAPVSVTPFLDGVLTVHQGGVVSYTDGSGTAAFARSAGGSGGWITVPATGPQGPISDINAAVPTFSTSWVDKAGATHKVDTPIVSTTPAGINKAKDLHKALVQALQTEFPPAKP